MEQADVQKRMRDTLSVTDNVMKQVTAQQALSDRFSEISRSASDNLLERYGSAMQRSLIAEIVADSHRYDSLLHSFTHSNDISRTSEAILAIQGKSRRMLEQNNSVLDRYSSVTQQIASQLAEYNVGASVYAHAISRASLVDTELERLRSTIGMTMLSQLHENDLSFSESVEIVKSTVHREIKDGQASAIGLAGWMNIAFFAITIWFAFQLSTQTNEQIADSEARIQRGLSAMQTELREQIGQLEQDSNTYFVAITETNVRSGPSTEHKIIAVILPNQHLRLLESDGRWLYVEYFDYLEETALKGWVYKRLLREITLVD